MSAILPSPHVGADLGTIDALNRECFCFSLDKDALARALDAELGRPGLSEMVRQRCPFVFAAQPVFVAAPQLQRMAQVVQAVESVVALPAYREQVLGAAPAIARRGTNGPRGAFFGYDFHLNQGRLGLIEINTNAGGAMLNAVLARAQRACCAAMDDMVPSLASVAAFERRIIDMFRDEWRLAGQGRPLASIAIVDEAPEQQYLYPEFLLFQQLFERHGLRAAIADPAALEWRDGTLWHGDLAIDLVYNRLTDFYLEQPGNSALREAYLQQGIALTPHPQVHALYADKSHLALFSDAARLQALGVPAATQQILLEHVPRTEVVDATHAQRLWDGRRGLFFKPVAGFGSRAAYRGDKLTRRVWQDILAGDYVAQAIVAPGERMLDENDAAKTLKFDLRGLCLRRRRAVGGRAAVSGTDHQLPHAGRRLRAGLQHHRVRSTGARGSVNGTGCPCLSFNIKELSMDIKVLGTGCANCKNTIALIEQVAKTKGVSVTLQKVEELRDIMGYGVMSTPGVVIDGKVVHAGGVPSRDKIEQWLSA